MNAVGLQGVSKSYTEGQNAVADLNLTVAAGELLVLVGPSGSGKTTTLRLVAGLERLTRGRIFLGPQDVTEWPPWQRDVAMIFQRPALYPHLRVRANLTVGRDLRQGRRWWHRPPHRTDPAVRDLARQLGIDSLLERWPAELSGGEQQRVALGRALLRQPAVILLDEPFSALEPDLRIELRRDLHLLQRRQGATILYVTHDAAEALALGDRIAFLHRGRVLQVGTPDEMQQEPRWRQVASFFSPWPLRFLSGECGERGLQTTTGLLPLRPSETARWPPGRTLELAFPPSAVQLVSTDVGGLEGSVQFVEACPGMRWLVTFQSGVGVLTALTDQAPPHPGETVRAVIHWDQVRWFDATTGQTLSTC